MKSYFLGIGINTYQSPLNNLQGACRELQELLDTLNARYLLNQAELFLNEQAIKSYIFYHLKQLEKKVCPEDQLLIYFSGHGYLDSKNEGYWIPYDGKPNYLETFMKLSTIKNLIHSIRVRHTLLISDSCYSGALGRNINNLEMIQDINHHNHKSFQIITSGRQEDTAIDGKNGHNSPFSTYLLRTLANHSSGDLTAEQLYLQIKRQMRFRYKQIPQFFSLFGTEKPAEQFTFRLKEPIV